MISFGGGGTKEIADRPRGRKARAKCGSNSNTQRTSMATQRIYCAFRHRQWVLPSIVLR